MLFTLSKVVGATDQGKGLLEVETAAPLENQGFRGTMGLALNPSESDRKWSHESQAGLWCLLNDKWASPWADHSPKEADGSWVSSTCKNHKNFTQIWFEKNMLFLTWKTNLTQRCMWKAGGGNLVFSWDTFSEAGAFCLWLNQTPSLLAKLAYHGLTGE